MKTKSPATAAAPKRTVYQIITDLVIAQLEKGVAVWQQPWVGNNGDICPRNYATGRNYSGVNAFLLNYAANGQAPYFLTFKQGLALGGAVRRGEKGFPIIYFQPTQKADAEKDEKGQRGVLQYFTVFHYSQFDGINFELPVVEMPEPLPVIEAAEALVAYYTDAPKVTYAQQRAYYSKSLDYVNMPKRDSFKSAEGFYATLFHELAHSTDHAKRLNREGIVEFSPFGTERYAKEELVAEMAASFLCGFAGIPSQVEQSAAYLDNWLSALKKDPKLIISAASQAEKAVRYMLKEQHPQDPAPEQAQEPAQE
jgi:antirestriction protein ArdC